MSSDGQGKEEPLVRRPPADPSVEDMRDANEHLTRAALEAVRQAEETGVRYQDLVHGVDAIVWEATAETMQHTFVSERTQAILGYPPERWLTEPNFWAEVTHPDDRLRVVNACKVCAATGQDFQIQYRAVASDGHPVWLRMIAGVRRQDDGPLQIRGLLLDISEARQKDVLQALVHEQTAALTVTEQRLRALALELSRAAESERKHLAAELHDNLAQLLVFCKIRLEALQKHPDMNRRSQALEEVTTALHQALSYTRTLMSELHPSLLGDETDLTTAIRWVSEKLQRRGLSVTMHDDGARKCLEDDVLRVVYQSIQELLWNVLKHAGTNEAEIYLKQSGDRLEAVVTDRGVGFEASRMIPSKEGGFGLFNIRERLESVGGRLEITSLTGQETSIKLQVALKKRPDESTSLALEQAAQPGVVRGSGTKESTKGAEHSKIRVLLVDDHRILREGLHSALREQSDMLVVAEAADGQGAVEKVRECLPDVVVMDVNMPVMNGVEATRRIMIEFPGTIVIGLSVAEDMQVKEALREAGAAAFLSKGGSFDYLCAAIRENVKAGPQ
ncbi:MAG TPA: response regulator [Nitrospiraceae bacterium]|nr:response regulator [Nitrospiraceae bacterium]